MKGWNEEHDKRNVYRADIWPAGFLFRRDSFSIYDAAHVCRRETDLDYAEFAVSEEKQWISFMPFLYLFILCLLLFFLCF